VGAREIGPESTEQLWRGYRTFAVIELSASGYRAIGVDRAGRLVDDLLVSNPRCGAGSGINPDRVLQACHYKKRVISSAARNPCPEAKRGIFLSFSGVMEATFMTVG